MTNEFDFVQYNKYVGALMALMDELGDPDVLAKLHNATIPTLNLLGVAYLSYEYQEQARESGLKIEEFPLPPTVELGVPNRDVTVDIKPKVSDMVTIRLYAHPFIDRPEWDDEQKELVRNYISIYFNCIARIRVLRMFESRIFQDQRMPFVGNLAALMRNIARLKAMGLLHTHTIYRLNIYRFSRINRILGRDVGDKIMEEYIRKLLSFSGQFGGVYRLGGDNFLGLVPNEMVPAVHKFFEGYTYVNYQDGASFDIQSRAGFYSISSNEDNYDMILGRANSTFTKATPKNKIKYFDIEEEKIENERSVIESEFIDAMNEGNVIPYYQPKVDPETNTIVGVEALCRWIKDGEIISPAVFISVLERNNQICTLDLYMLRKVCEDIKAWIDAGHTPVRASINFSRNNIADKNFVSKVISTIDEYDIPRSAISIELTETTLEEDFEEFKRVVTEFKNQGVLVSVDDFGTGFSSMNLIKDIDWDVIKIDKSYVPDEKNPKKDKSTAMLENIIAMVNKIGMVTVLEGVETEEQKKIVVDFGCKVIQGYYYDKPMPKEELEAKILGTYKGKCKWHA